MDNQWQFLNLGARPKSPLGHRLIDSNRPATTHFKDGSLTINADTISLVKNRHFIRFLTFVLLTPVWGGLTIGVAVLVGSLLGDIANKHVGTTLLVVAAIVISAVAILISMFVKPIRRQFLLSQVANAQIKHVQITRNDLAVSAGWLGVDFSVVSVDSTVSTIGELATLPAADAEKSSFVTFIARSESDASALWQLLPKTQVLLRGKRNADIPPQQAARWINPETRTTRPELSPNLDQTSRERKYPHDTAMRYLIILTGIMGAGALDMGYLAMTNDRGLVINGLIRLGPTGATIFYSLITVFLGAFFLYCAAMLLQRIINPHSLIIRHDGIIFCDGRLKPKQTLVPFAAIQMIGQQQGVKGGTRTLVLKVGNQKFLIHEEYLGNRRNYDEIYATVASAQNNIRQTQRARTRPPEPPVGDDSRYMPKG